MSIYVPPRPAVSAAVQKAGPLGPGAGVLQTEFLLSSFLQNDPHKRMQQAYRVGWQNAYVRSAERVISGRFASMPWHLEDPDGEVIDDEYADPRAVAAYRLINAPQAAVDVRDVGRRLSRYEFMEVTSRHSGLAGNAAWYLDQRNGFGCPAALLYIRPDRLTPVMRSDVILSGWLLDKGPGQPGTPLDITDVRIINLQVPDSGVFAPGLVESALIKATLNDQIDKHFSAVLQSGGRISGIISPKTGSIPNDSEGDNTFQQLIRDWRNVTEQPDAARRAQVVRAPLDFTKTVQSIDEMKLVDLMTRNRDDVLAVWGVPLSQIGGATPAGLNSGDVRKYDEAALIQNAVEPRLTTLADGTGGGAIQEILDLWAEDLGWAPKFVWDLPEFDDDSPRYDKLQKAQFLPMRNWERRKQINLEPLGRDVLNPTTGNPVDDEIMLPSTLVLYGHAPTPVPGTAAALAPTIEAERAAEGQSDNTSAVAATKAKADALPAVLAALRKQWSDADLAIVRQGSWTFDPAFPIRKINADRRPNGRNPRIVQGVEAALQVGAPIAPVTIVHTKRIGKPGYEPVDGWHRTLAAEHEGLKKIPAYVGEGDDAWTRAMIAIDDDMPTPPDSAGQSENEAAGKAGFAAGLKQLRATLDAQVQPRLRATVGLVLGEQRRDVIARVRTQWDKLKANPRDTTLWWRPQAWDAAMRAALQPALTSTAEQVQAHVQASLGKAGPVGATAVVARVLRRGVARVAGINETTREAIAEIIAQGILDGLSPADLGDAIEAASVFDEYRAEMIARTETMDAYNAAALVSYGEFGVTEVQAIDGDGDEECAARDGQTFPIDEADGIEDHPNGTLDWIPVLPEEAS